MDGKSGMITEEREEKWRKEDESKSSNERWTPFCRLHLWRSSYPLAYHSHSSPLSFFIFPYSLFIFINALLLSKSLQLLFSLHLSLLDIGYLSIRISTQMWTQVSFGANVRACMARSGPFGYTCLACTLRWRHVQTSPISTIAEAQAGTQNIPPTRHMHRSWQ